VRQGQAARPMPLIPHGVYRMPQVQMLLRGPEGSAVTLGILRSDEQGQLLQVELSVERKQELGHIRRSSARADAQAVRQSQQLLQDEQQRRAAAAAAESAMRQQQSYSSSSSSGLSFFGLPVSSSTLGAESRSYIESFSQRQQGNQEAALQRHLRVLFDALGAAREAFHPSDKAAAQAQVLGFRVEAQVFVYIVYCAGRCMLDAYKAYSVDAAP